MTLMLIDIQSLALEDVRDRVRAALRSDVDPEDLADFVAEVDWSSHESATADVRAALGQLEEWLTRLAEGDMSVSAFRASLLQLLPAEERAGSSTS